MTSNDSPFDYEDDAAPSSPDESSDQPDSLIADASPVAASTDGEDDSPFIYEPATGTSKPARKSSPRPSRPDAPPLGSMRGLPAPPNSKTFGGYSLDQRLQRIRQYNPALADAAEEFVRESKARGFNPQIRSDVRDAAHQRWLHDNGYPTKGNDGYIKLGPHQLENGARAIDWAMKGQPAAFQRFAREFATSRGFTIPSDEPWHWTMPRKAGSKKADASPFSFEQDEEASPFEFVEEDSATNPAEIPAPPATQETAQVSQPAPSPTSNGYGPVPDRDDEFAPASPEILAEQAAQRMHPFQIDTVNRAAADLMGRRASAAEWAKKEGITFAPTEIDKIVALSEGVKEKKPEAVRAVARHKQEVIRRQTEQQRMMTIKPDDFAWHLGINDIRELSPPLARRAAGFVALQVAADKKRRERGEQIAPLTPEQLNANRRKLGLAENPEGHQPPPRLFINGEIPGISDNPLVKASSPLTNIDSISRINVRPNPFTPESARNVQQFADRELPTVVTDESGGAALAPLSQDEQSRQQSLQQGRIGRLITPKFYSFLKNEGKLSDDDIEKIATKPAHPYDLRGINKFGYNPEKDQVRMSLPEAARGEYDQAVAQSTYRGPINSFVRATLSQIGGQGASAIHNSLANMAATQVENMRSSGYEPPSWLTKFAEEQRAMAQAIPAGLARAEDVVTDVHKSTEPYRPSMDLMRFVTASIPSLGEFYLAARAGAKTGQPNAAMGAYGAMTAPEFTRQAVERSVMGAQVFHNLGEATAPFGKIVNSLGTGVGTYVLAREEGASPEEAAKAAIIFGVGSFLHTRSNLEERVEQARGSKAVRKIQQGEGAASVLPENVRAAAARFRGSEPIIVKDTDGRVASVFVNSKTGATEQFRPLTETEFKNLKGAERGVAEITPAQFDEFSKRAESGEKITPDVVLEPERLTAGRKELPGQPGQQPAPVPEPPDTLTPQVIPNERPAPKLDVEEETGRIIEDGKPTDYMMTPEGKRVPIAVEEPKGMEVVDRAYFEQFDTPEGMQLDKASDALAQKIETHLANGDQITLIVNNDEKRVPITSVTRGMMQDAKGQRWGAMGLATGDDRVEIVPQTTQATETDSAPAEESDLYGQVLAFSQQEGKASAKAIQSKFKLPYGQVVGMIDRMDAEGHLGPKNGKVRDVITVNAQSVINKGGDANELSSSSSANGSKPKPTMPRPDAAAKSPKTEAAASVPEMRQGIKIKPLGKAIEAAQADEPRQADDDSAQETHKFSWTQVDLPEGESKLVRSVGKRLIADSDLYVEEGDAGREPNPHITVKYGIHAETDEEVRAALAGHKSLRAKLGKISVFPANGKTKFDVVMVEVHSPDLHGANAKIAEGTKHTDTHPEYVPHLTLAYVKAGLGKKYAGNTALAGKTFTFDKVVFSSKTGETSEIALNGAAKAHVSHTKKRDTPKQAEEARATPPTAASQSKATTSEIANGEWRNFTPESGSLGVPRSSMPQIKSEHRGAMVQFLKGRGIAHTRESVAPNTLKPSQAEFSPAKVGRARSFEGEQRSILVSSDDHVADGHHQWLSSLDTPEEPIPVIRFDAPIKSLLLEMARFPSSGIDESSNGKVANDVTPRAEQDTPAIKEQGQPALTRAGRKQQAKLDRAANRKPRARQSADPKKHSLWRYVQLMGGIRPDENSVGELRRLSQKELGKPFLVNRNSNLSIEEMARSAWDDGYLRDISNIVTDAEYGHVDPHAFLEAIEDDARGITSHPSTENPIFEDIAALGELSAEEEKLLEREARFMQDKDAQPMLAEVEKTGKIASEIYHDLVTIGATYGLDEEHIGITVRSLREIALARLEAQDEAGADALLSQSEPTIFAEEELDETEPEGDVDTSFDFADEGLSPKNRERLEQFRAAVKSARILTHGTSANVAAKVKGEGFNQPFNYFMVDPEREGSDRESTLRVDARKLDPERLFPDPFDNGNNELFEKILGHPLTEEMGGLDRAIMKELESSPAKWNDAIEAIWDDFLDVDLADPQTLQGISVVYIGAVPKDSLMGAKRATVESPTPISPRKLEDYRQPEQSGLGFREAESGLFAKGGARPVEDFARQQQERFPHDTSGYLKGLDAAYGDLMGAYTDLSSSTDPLIQKLVKELSKRTDALARARRANPEDMTGRDLVAALSKLAGLRSQNQTVPDYLNQPVLIGEKDLTPEQESILAEINRTGRLPDGLIKSEAKTEESRLFAGSPLKMARAESKATAPPFFSQLQRTIEQKMPNRASVEQVRSLITNPQNGVKADEIKWTGLDDFLAGKESVTMQDVLNFLAQNNVKVEEVTKGGANVVKRIASDYYQVIDSNGKVISTHSSRGDANANAEKGTSATEFSKYTLPGAKEGSYRELLLTLPDGTPPAPTTKDIGEIQETEHQYVATIGTKKMDVGKGVVGSKEEARKYFENYLTKYPAEFAPKSQAYKSSHFNEPNILAHIRFNERTDAEGKRVLFIEEVQSDWHQAGRKEGYAEKPHYSVMSATGARVLKEGGRGVAVYANKAEAEAYATKHSGWYVKEVPGPGVPDAPFKKNWHELATKRVLRYAAENGYDKVAWTTGEQQAERYDLSKQVDLISWGRRGDGRYDLTIAAKSGDSIQKNNQTEAQLEELIGKEPTQKIISDAGVKSSLEDYASIGSLSGDGLKVGGEGMRGFYDRILPSFMSKYGKKWGARVGEARVIIDVPEAFRDKRRPQQQAVVHAIDITSSMRQSVTGEGQPLFQKAADEKNLDDLAAKDFAELVPEATVTRDGHLLELNAEAHEIMRRAFEQRLIDEGQVEGAPEPVFDGVFLTPNQITQTVATLRKAVKEMRDNGYTAEQAAPLEGLANHLTAAKMAGKGTAVAYVFDYAVPHEEFHRAGYQGALGEALASRHALFTELAAHPAINKAWNAYFNRVRGYSRFDEAVLVEETAAWIAGGKAATIGLSEDDAADFMRLWFTSFVEKNGEDALSHFEEVALPHVSRVIGQLREGRADARAAESRLQGDERRVSAKQKEEPGRAKRGDQGSSQGGAQVDAALPVSDIDIPASASSAKSLGGDGLLRSGDVARTTGTSVNQRYRALPSTLREQGLRAADELYDIYGDKAATADAKRLLETLGFDGAIARLNSGTALGAEDVQLSKILQRALLREASKIAETDPGEAEALRVQASELASSLGVAMTNAGQFIRGAQVIDSAAEDVVAAATKIARERGRPLTPEEIAQSHAVGEELETAAAEVEIAAAEARDGRAQAIEDRRIMGWAEEGRLTMAEIEALRKRLALLKAKEKSREKRISDLDALMPERQSRKVSRPSKAAVRRKAVAALSVDEDALMADVRSALGMGSSPLRMAQAEGDINLPNPPPHVIDAETLEKLAKLGALKLLRAERGRLTVEGFKNSMLADFGEAIRPHLNLIHADAVRMARISIARARREAQIDAISEREGNENLSREELEAITDSEREERRRVALVRAEHDRAANKYDEEHGRKEKKPRAGRAAGANKAKRTVDLTSRTIEGVVVNTRALADAIGRRAANPLEAIAAAKLSLGRDVNAFATEMAHEHGVTPEESKELFAAGGRVLTAARADIRASQEMATALKGVIANSDAERDRALANLQRARAKRQRATRRVASHLTALRKGKARQAIGNVWRGSKGVMISLMASGDISNLLRQGGIAVAMHPSLMPAFARATIASINDGRFASRIDAIEQDDDFALMQRMGVDFAFAGEASGEEWFEGADVLQRIPIVRHTLGKLVDKSDKMFGGGLDHLRFALSKMWISELRANDVSYSEHPGAYKDIARFVNIITGRGDIGHHNSAPTKAYLALGRMIGFAPRFRVSRLQFLTLPFNLSFWNADPFARRIIYKNMARWYATMGATMIALTALGWAVGMGISFDPDDDDFLKLKMGKLRLDLTAGLTVHARTMGRLMKEGWRLVDGQVTGEMSAREAAKIGGRWLWSGSDPRASLIIDAITGETFDRQKFSWFGDHYLDGAIGSRLMPITWSDFLKFGPQEGWGVSGAKAAADMVGISANAYPDSPNEPHTQGERLAVRWAHKIEFTRGGKAWDEETQRKLDELKTRARAGEDVSSEVKPLVDAGTITENVGESIIKAKEQTLLQEKFRRLDLEEAMHVHRYLSEDEKASVADIIRQKVMNKVEKKVKAGEQAAKDAKRPVRPGVKTPAERRAEQKEKARQTRQKNREKKYGKEVDATLNDLGIRPRRVADQE